MQLHQKLKEDVLCVTVDLDFIAEDEREEVEEEVLAKLRQKGVAVRNIIQGDPNFDIQSELDMTVPIVLVYDQAGELARAFHNGDEEFKDGHFTYEKDVIPFVEKLLEGKS